MDKYDKWQGPTIRQGLFVLHSSMSDDNTARGSNRREEIYM